MVELKYISVMTILESFQNLEELVIVSNQAGNQASN
jgi:hypothetical protein